MELQEVEMTEAQERLFAQGMIAVARCDGAIDPREAELISELSAGDLESLPDPEASALSANLTGDAARLFLRSCYLVALVDQSLSDAEKGLIDGYAAALSVPVEEVEGIHQSVKEFLIAPLTRLANVEVAAEVARKME